MTTLTRWVRSLAGVPVLWLITAAAQAGSPADLILDNGFIDGTAQSVAIQSGVIVAIGAEEDVRKLRSSTTRVVDVGGDVVLPGLHDMHVHPLMAGLAHQQCNFPQGAGAATIREALKKCAGEKPKGTWIIGGQWDGASVGRALNVALLDQAAPDHPVVLTDISLHSLWVNSKALQLAGIDAKTPDPAGGVIERSRDGKPTGVLREAAAQLVRRIVPPATPEQNVAALKWSLQLMLSYGITSFADALADEKALRAYAALADAGELKQRVIACIPWRQALDGPADDSVIERRNSYARDRFSPSCIKAFLDGVPTDAHTAAMLAPYAGLELSHDTRARGLLLVPQQELNAAVMRFDRQGLLVKFHAAGDGAVRSALDAIEAARRANGYTGRLHQVGHDSFIDPSDLTRAAALGAVFEFSPYIWFENPIIADIRKAVGDERMRRWIPVKDALDAQALVVPGSDWSVVPSVNPWIGMETLVSRRPPGGGPELAPGQAVTRQQALDMFTVNSARAAGHADRLGRLERGMLADLIVVDRDPLRAEIGTVHDTRVRLTLINGEVVYQNDDGRR
ncbi:amidohydrolase [Steroidobacter sp.]|uniref:amidohydrolase n=1 Tax=Steroidobacter sp. TaxID=1978227 RepID=UPI001A47CB30|nr:amidohydrolase [Steroidobacter sp.]MBL8266673.1 amidohydrolase [Steroidobacter sp.]